MSHGLRHVLFQLGIPVLLLGFAGVLASFRYESAFRVGLVALAIGIILVAIGHEEKEKEEPALAEALESEGD